MRNEKEQRVRDYNDSIKRTKSQTMTKIVQSIEQISLFVEINESKKNLCVFVALGENNEGTENQCNIILHFTKLHISEVCRKYK